MRILKETVLEWDHKFEIAFSKIDSQLEINKLWERKDLSSRKRIENDQYINVKSVNSNFKLKKDICKQLDKVNKILKRLPEGQLRVRYLFQQKSLNQIHFNKSFDRQLWTLEFQNDKIEVQMSNIKLTSRLLAEFCKKISNDISMQSIDWQKAQARLFSKNTIVEFSNVTIGFILHEALGHRLEGDDFSEPIIVKQKPNFEVYDSPGIKGWWGYTPWDDQFNKGKEIPLLIQKSKKFATHLIKGEAGNMRSFSLQWHPIIRQRNLITKIKGQKILPPKHNRKLLIESISLGSFENEIVGLNVSEAKWLDGDKEYKVEPFYFEFNLNKIFEFNLFGKSEVHHISGGCHKSYQRQLPITFCSHRGWITADIFYL